MASADVQQFLTLLLGTGVDNPTAIRALAIGYAESGGVANKVSAPNSNGTRDYGFMQINSAHFGEAKFKASGWNAQTMLQLGPNIDAARYLSGGWKNWQPWTTFKTNAYLNFVPQATTEVTAWTNSKNPFDAAGNAAQTAGSAAAGAVGSAASTAQSVLTGAVTWLNASALTIAVGILGLLLVGVGVWLLVKDNVEGAVDKVVKAVPIA